MIYICYFCLFQTVLRSAEGVVCVVCVVSYKQNSHVFQHVGVVQSVGFVLPAAHNMNTRLLLLQRQIHVVPESNQKHTLCWKKITEMFISQDGEEATQRHKVTELVSVDNAGPLWRRGGLGAQAGAGGLSG